MQNKDMQNLEKPDLLAIIKKQQDEINSLKGNIKNLKKKLNKQEKKYESIINDISSKMNMVIEEAEQYLNNIKEVSAEVNKYLDTIKASADESEIEENAETITNEEKLEDTNVNDDVNINIDTKEKSQIDEKEKCVMLIPIHTDLAIIEPIYIKLKRKKIFMLLVYIVSIFIILFSLFNFLKVYRQDWATRELTGNLREFVSENAFDAKANSNDSKENLVNFEELKKINSDTCGWIKVDGIEIDMPVVQADNNEYYLKYSFDKTYNPSGWAFVDYRNKLDGTDKNIIIYGHNRRDNIMFSPLLKILESNWYNEENNKYVTFISENGEKNLYEICSIYQTEAEEFYIQTDFSKEEDHKNFLDAIKSRSIKKYDINLDTNDQILTLSTCGNNSKYRVILHAKKVK